MKLSVFILSINAFLSFVNGRRDVVHLRDSSIGAILQGRQWFKVLHQSRHPSPDTHPLTFLASSSKHPPTNQDFFQPDVDSNNISADERPRFWSPWPFSLISRRDTILPTGDVSLHDSRSHRRSIQSTVSMLWSITKRSSEVAFRTSQEVGSQIWFHTPPVFPPLVLYATIPRQEKMFATEGFLYKTVIPIWSNLFVRNLALSGAGLALISWLHAEWYHKRRLTPLILAEPYRDMNRAVLPPFLPEVEPEIVDTQDTVNNRSYDQNQIDPVTAINDDHVSVTTPRLRQHWQQFKSNVPKQLRYHTRVQNWMQMRQVRKIERRNAHRITIMDELVALQIMKKKTQKLLTDKDMKSNHDDAHGPGYALVTGASKGIGRSIAVELARWGIPLVLVARDIDSLMALAYDIQACYGVDCCVLQADLSKPTSAKSIYKTVKDAGLNVQVLVNNAGISTQGESVEIPLESIERMIQVNAVSVTSLTQLFGRDMKDQRCGRILIVSSICGAVSGIASVAIYSATKAFENSFAIAIGKELEPYGVGVTCLMPGAVRGTEFQKRSDAHDALCWKIPFYSKTGPFVAECGVRAMLRGETLITPGFMNRLFLKVVKPVLSERLHNLVAEIAWSPFYLPFACLRNSIESGESGKDLRTVLSPQNPLLINNTPLNALVSQPRILKLQEPELKSPTKDTTSNIPHEIVVEVDPPVDPAADLSTDSQPSRSTTDEEKTVDGGVVVDNPPMKQSGSDTDGSDVMKQELPKTVVTIEKEQRVACDLRYRATNSTFDTLFSKLALDPPTAAEKVLQAYTMGRDVMSSQIERALVE